MPNDTVPATAAGLPTAWIIETVDLETIATINEAYRLWKQLIAERRYRGALLADNVNSDEFGELMKSYDGVTDGLLRGIAGQRSTDLGEVTSKIRLVIRLEREKEGPEDFTVELLDSLHNDLVYLRHSKGPEEL